MNEISSEFLTRIAQLPPLNDLQRYWIGIFGEFIGTALLILLGNGVCAATGYKRMIANQKGNKWILIVVGWGCGVYLAALLCDALGGLGHLNPAVSIMASIKAMSEPIANNSLYAAGMSSMGITSATAIIWITFALLVTFQLTGAIFGQMILNILTLRFIKDEENTWADIRHAHCTCPVYDNKNEKGTMTNFLFEFTGTLVLAGFVVVLSNHKNVENTGLNVAGLPVVFLLMSVVVSLGSATGCALNPVRDFSPRLVLATFTKSVRKHDFDKSVVNWGYAWVPIVAPMLAGTCIGLISWLIPAAQ